jgi:uncharacterized protein DUF3592
MQVVLQTPSQLVVHDGRWSTVLMGAIFSSIGAGVMWLRWTHPEGWSGNGGPWVVYVVGSVFVAGSLVIFWLSADRRYVIDRATHTVTIVVQRLVHRQTTLLPFKDIDDVALEESPGFANRSGSTSSPTYRVVFLMKDGSRVPWTPYSTNARESQETSAAAARAFGGWAGNPEHQVQPVTATPALISHPVATHWGCLASILALFVAPGLGLFGLEVYRVAMWRPVAARVISSDVGSVRGSKGGVSYKPVIRYTYTYDGIQYSSYGVTPIDISASEAWARSIVARYHPAAVTTAYVNPGNPASALLVREPSLIPLVFVVIPVLLGLLFSWMIHVQRRQVQLADKHLVPVVNAMSLQQSR